MARIREKWVDATLLVGRWREGPPAGERGQLRVSGKGRGPARSPQKRTSLADTLVLSPVNPSKGCRGGCFLPFPASGVPGVPWLVAAYPLSILIPHGLSSPQQPPEGAWEHLSQVLPPPHSPQALYHLPVPSQPSPLLTLFQPHSLLVLPLTCQAQSCPGAFAHAVPSAAWNALPPDTSIAPCLIALRYLLRGHLLSEASPAFILFILLHLWHPVPSSLLLVSSTVYYPTHPTVIYSVYCSVLILPTGCEP